MKASAIFFFFNPMRSVTVLCYMFFLSKYSTREKMLAANIIEYCVKHILESLTQRSFSGKWQPVRKSKNFSSCLLLASCILTLLFPINITPCFGVYACTPGRRTRRKHERDYVFHFNCIPDKPAGRPSISKLDSTCSFLASCFSNRRTKCRSLINGLPVRRRKAGGEQLATFYFKAQKYMKTHNIQ